MRLRQQRSTTQTLLVFIDTNPFSQHDAQYHNACTLSLPAPTAHTGKLIGYAVQGVEALYRAGYRYQKAGIMLLNLAPQSQRQLDLLSSGDTARSQTLMAVLDQINARMGRGTLRFGREGFGQLWAMHQARRSPAYTTRWDQLPLIYA